MKVSIETLHRYSKALNAIADESVHAFMAEMDDYAAVLGPFEGWTDEQKAHFRDYAIDRMSESWGVYGDASASVGSMLFDETIEGGIPKGYDMADQVDASRARASAHYWAKFMHGYDANIDQFLNGCASFVRRNVSHSADMTAIDIARKDKRIKYARIPQGPTCGFCIMLASRGFVYSNEDAAGKAGQYHDDCDCRILPGYDGLQVEGYDPEGMYRRYLACRDTIGGPGQLWKDWQALTPEERDEFGRGVRARAFSDDPDMNAQLMGQLSKQANGFNDYVAHRICQEMDTRDRRWLYDGTVPEVTFESAALRKEIEEKRPHEIEIANRLSGHGIKSHFVVDRRTEIDPSTGQERTIGLADMAGGIELKALLSAQGVGAVDKALRDAGHKEDMRICVIDNSWHQLEDSAIQSEINYRMVKRGVGECLFLRGDGKMLRMKSVPNEP